jgi:hypothetical protein
LAVTSFNKFYCPFYFFFLFAPIGFLGAPEGAAPDLAAEAAIPTLGERSRFP